MTMTPIGIDRGKAPLLPGARMVLRELVPEHVTDRYLSWLNDDIVNQYSRRYRKPAQTVEDVLRWMNGLGRDEVAFAIEVPGLGHIGNVKYGPVNWSNLDADLSIMVGATESWGQGYGAEAMYLVTRHLFVDRGLNRVHAGSVNPAFIRMVEKLGWQREGIQREEARIDGEFRDSVLLSFLRREFVCRPEYEPVADQSG